MASCKGVRAGRPGAVERGQALMSSLPAEMMLPNTSVLEALVPVVSKVYIHINTQRDKNTLEGI